MNSTKTKLKPLNHKKTLNEEPTLLKTQEKKPISKPVTSHSNPD